jgi:hypothetical protein
MLPQALRIMEYPTQEEVDCLAAACTGRNQIRDQLLIHTLFQTWALPTGPQVFGEPTLTAGLLDRLTHKANIITCDWESFRLQESLKAKDITLDKG